jgi:DNA-binding XRE family transcriptional regulator
MRRPIFNSDTSSATTKHRSRQNGEVGSDMGIAGKPSQTFNPCDYNSCPGWRGAPKGRIPMSWASETFGRRLAQIRADRRMTQQDLGAAIGLSRQTIIRWENDPAFDPRLGDMKKCAWALRCRVGDLLAPLDAPIPPRPRFSWIVDATGALRPRPNRTARPPA